MRRFFWKGVFWLVEPLLDQLDARRSAQAKYQDELSKLPDD
jgi:hypothetical protein